MNNFEPDENGILKWVEGKNGEKHLVYSASQDNYASVLAAQATGGFVIITEDGQDMDEYGKYLNFSTALEAQLCVQEKVWREGFVIPNSVKQPISEKPAKQKSISKFSDDLTPYDLFAAVGMLIASRMENGGHEFEQRVAVQAHNFAVEMLSVKQRGEDNEAQG